MRIASIALFWSMVAATAAMAQDSALARNLEIVQDGDVPSWWTTEAHSSSRSSTATSHGPAPRGAIAVSASFSPAAAIATACCPPS